MTPFGKQLFLAKSEAEAKKLLGITSDSFVDEGGNLWVVPTNNKAFITPAGKKFGTRSLSFDSASAQLQTATPLIFGGDPFTISCWAKYSSTGYFFRALGMAFSCGFSFEKVNPSYNFLRFYTGTTSASAAQIPIGAGAAGLDDQTANVWRHYEIAYNGSKGLYVFVNGSKIWQISKTVDREPRKIIFGGTSGYIDEFRILDGICEHTAKFTVPTTAYKCSDYPDNTLSLMHFE